MSIQLKALQNFTGPDGKHRLGDVFEVSAERAKFLESGGYAERATKRDQKEAARTSAEEASPAAASRPSKTTAVAKSAT